MEDSTADDGAAGDRSDGDHDPPTSGGPAEEGRDAPTTADLAGTSGRRPFLRALPVPPLIGALAGCGSLSDESEETTAGPDAPDDPGGGDESTPTPGREVSVGDTVAFGDAIRFERSFRLTGEVRAPGDGSATETTLTGRARDLNHRLRIERDDVATDLYLVDGDRYVVRDGDCVSYPDVAVGADDLEVPDQEDGPDGESELRLVGTERGDGRDLLVYELAGEAGGEADADAPTPRFYVGRETGYLRRLELGSVAFRFDGWAESQPPVEPPDGDCRSAAAPDPAFYAAEVSGTADSAVTGLTVTDHAAGAGTYGTDAVDAAGFHVRLTVENAGDASTDLLAYDYEVDAYDAAGTTLSGDGTTTWSLGGSPTEGVVPAGGAGAVVVAPDGVETPSEVARYELRLGCDGTGAYCEDGAGEDEETDDGQDDPPDAADPGWSTFQHDPARTAATGAGVGPSTPVEVAWDAALPGPAVGSPVVGDETVYVGDEAGRLHAVPRGGGDPRWSTDVRAPVRSAPHLTADLVLVANRDGTLYAVDRASGERTWSLETDAPIDDTPPALPSPVGVDGVVYHVSPGGTVLAFDVAERAIRWGFDAEATVHASPAVADGVVVVATTAGDVLALDAADGGVRWRASLGTRVEATPAVADGDLYIATFGGRVLSYEAASGDERWRFTPEVAASVLASPAVTGDRIYVGDTSGGRLRALGTAAGEVAWVRGGSGPLVASPAVAGDVVHVVDTDGVAAAVDGATGDTVWERAADRGGVGSPAVTGGRAYLVTVTGGGARLLALE
jgi:outer membrane protein assembly factor BamB